MHVGEVALERRRLDLVDRQHREDERVLAERIAVGGEHERRLRFRFLLLFLSQNQYLQRSIPGRPNHAIPRPPCARAFSGRPASGRSSPSPWADCLTAAVSRHTSPANFQGGWDAKQNFAIDRTAVRVFRRGAGPVPGDIGADRRRLRQSGIGRLRRAQQGAVRRQLRRAQARPGGQGRRGLHQQGRPGRQGDRKAVPARRGRREAAQAQGHLDPGRPPVGHRHRRGLGVRPENEEGAQVRAARRGVRQRPGGDGRRALHQRQPRRQAGEGRAGGLPQHEGRAQAHRDVHGQGREPERRLPGARRPCC